mgnify:FL=1
MAELKKKLHGFKSKITAGFRSLSRRQRRLMLLDVLLIGLVVALYVLFFVPRDGTAMFQMAAQRSRRITSCVQDMSLKTELEISFKDLVFSQKKKSAAEKCPVQIRVKMKQGEGGAKINRTTKVTLNGKTSSFKTLSYYDAKQKVLYSRKSSGWSRKENQANQVSDVQTLLNLNKDVLQNSAFAKTDRGYEVRLPAERAGVSPIAPLLRDEANTEITGGEFCYVFGKFSHRLLQIEGNNLKVQRNGKKAETCTIRIKFTDYNKLESADWKVPEKIRKSAEAPAKDAKNAKSYLLSQAELKKDERDCYVVGEDLPAGKYVTGKRTGEGIITCLRHSDAKVRFEYHCGYGYYAVDNYKKGREVTLENGDRIMLSGKKLAIRFRRK